MSDRSFIIMTETATYGVRSPWRFVASFWALWLRLAGFVTGRPTKTYVMDLGTKPLVPKLSDLPPEAPSHTEQQ